MCPALRTAGFNNETIETNYKAVTLKPPEGSSQLPIQIYSLPARVRLWASEGRNADKIPRHTSEINYVRMVLHCAMF